MGKNNSSYEFTDRFFVNPYNFIPTDFSKEVRREKPDESEHTHSGVLKCELLPVTPLAVPDTAHDFGDGNHKEFNFMRTPEGNLMIPGSSLRGAIRSMYEALTNSCYVTAVPDEAITYRTKKAFLPGLIKCDEDGNWSLYEAKRYIFAVDDLVSFHKHEVATLKRNQLNNLKHGQEVYFTTYSENGKDAVYRKNGFEVGSYIKSFQDRPDEETKTGYLCLGERVVIKGRLINKHFESVFYPERKNDQLTAVKIDSKRLEKAVHSLNSIVKMYQDDSVNIIGKQNNQTFYKGRDYSKIPPNTLFPIWYSKANDNIYLSVAAIGRSAYNNQMKDMLGSHMPCENRDSVCPACMIFGMTGKTSAGSRIRITDAVTKNRVPYSKRVTLKELAGPKASYTPFYLRIKKEKDKVNWSYDEPAMELRGRKMYWHSTDRNYTDGKGDRNASMELCGTGKENRFSFSVYYDRLTDDELSKLIWTLTLGENSENSRHCYKLGHGKPIGLGSAKIIIREKAERIFSHDQYYLENQMQEEIKGNSDLFNSPETVKAVLTMTDLDAAKYPVSYPAVVDENGTVYSDKSNTHAKHQWFSHNYYLGKPPRKRLPEVDAVNGKPLMYVTDGGTVAAYDNQNQRDNADVSQKVHNAKEIKGILRFFNHDKQFGFAKVEGYGEKVYVPRRAISDYRSDGVYDNKEIMVVVNKTEKGYMATFCRIL